jgi:hypothetical protein
MAVVAFRVAGDEFVEVGRLLALQGLDCFGTCERPEEEIQVEIDGLAEGRACPRLSLGAEVQRALPAVGDEGIGQRAQRILDVRNAVGGAPDLDGSGWRVAASRCRGGTEDGTGNGKSGHAQAPRRRTEEGEIVHVVVR